MAATVNATDKNMNGLEHGDKKAEKPEKDVAPAPSINKPIPSNKDVSKNKMEKKVILPGDVTIKAQLDDDIRCALYTHRELTFNDLLKLLERMFKKGVKATDELILKYKDADGDYVTMEDTDDVGFAVRTCGSLNIRISRKKSDDEDSKLRSSEVRDELLAIKDKLNQLMDKLDTCELEYVKPTAPTLSTLSVRESDVQIGEKTQQKEEVGTSAKELEQSQVDQNDGAKVNNHDSPLFTGVSTGTPAPPQGAAGGSAQIQQVFKESVNKYSSMTGQGQNALSQSQSHYSVGGSAPVAAANSVSAPPVYPQANQPATTIYGSVSPAPSTPYVSSTQYPYQPNAPSYGSTASPYSQAPNPAQPTWPDSTATSQNRGYQMGGSSALPNTGQVQMSPGLPAQTQPGYNTASPAPQAMYGQIQQGQQTVSSGQMSSSIGGPGLSGPAAPPSMGGVQPPPPMSGVPPQMGSVQPPPQMGGVHATPSMTSVQAPPQMGGPQGMSQIGGPPSMSQMGGAQAPQMGVPPPMSTNYRAGGPPPPGGAGGSVNPFSRNATGRFGM